MLNHFPHDYMHLVCLGAMRKLLLLWIRGKIPVRLPSNLINQISLKLQEIKPMVPTDFARKPRSLREVDRWKATEFRQLLLYTGPYIFKSILPKSIYSFFLELHCAIKILAHQQPELADLDEAQGLLEYFFTNYKTLYGKEQLSYKVHSLIHLVNDVRNLGPLDQFSAFKFENHLQHIKKKLKHSALPLQQLIRRVYEQRNTDNSLQQTIDYSNNKHSGPTFQINHQDGPLINNLTNPQFKKLIFPTFSITLQKNENFLQLSNGDICMAENFAT